jgi:hypothetical protein
LAPPFLRIAFGDTVVPPASGELSSDKTVWLREFESGRSTDLETKVDRPNLFSRNHKS